MLHTFKQFSQCWERTIVVYAILRKSKRCFEEVSTKTKTLLFFLVTCSGPDLDGSGSDDDGDGRGGGGGDSPGDGPGPSHRLPPSSSVMKKTAQQIAGEGVLSRVVEEVEGVSFSFQWAP